MDTDYGFSVKILLFQGKYTPSSIWDSRQEWINYVDKSKEYWAAMSVEQQDGITHVVKHALQRLHDKVDTWLPEAIDVSSGSYVDLYVKILFTDAQEAIQKHNGMTNMRLVEAQNDSFELLAQLEADPPEKF